MQQFLTVLAFLIVTSASAATIPEQLATISNELGIPVRLAPAVTVDSDACLQQTITYWYNTVNGAYSSEGREAVVQELRRRLEPLHLRGIVFQSTATTAYLRGRVTRYQYTESPVSCESDSGCSWLGGTKIIDTDAFTVDGDVIWEPTYTRSVAAGVMSIQEHAPRVVGSYDVYSLHTYELMWGGERPNLARYYEGISSTRSADFQEMLRAGSVRHLTHWAHVAFQLCDLQERLSPWDAFPAQ